MRNGQRFTVVRDLIGKRHRLRRVKIEGIVNQWTIGGKRYREWRGTATIPFTRRNSKTVRTLLSTGSVLTLRGIGDVIIDYSYGQYPLTLCVGLVSTGVFTIPGNGK